MHLIDYKNSEEEFTILQHWLHDEKIFRYWCAGSFSYPLQREEIGSFLNESEARNAYFAVDDEDGIFGFCVLQSDESQNSELIRLVVINPEVQGKGYGSVLLNLAAEFSFINRNRDYADLDVFRENKRAVACYERNGFEICRDIDADIVLNGKLCPRYHMRKYR